jgi:prepilin-type N-terminal cleavage/methylation domain-containing protein
VPHWEGGFTLIETVVVLAILAALMAIGLVSYSRYTHLADNAAVQLDLLTAVKVQALNHLEQGQFTTDAAALRSLEPNLEYSGDGLDGSLVVAIEAGHAHEAVCVFGLSSSGQWFGVQHSLASGDRFGFSAPSDCDAAAVADWQPAGW